MTLRRTFLGLLAISLTGAALGADTPQQAATTLTWKNGPRLGGEHFPLAVWLQAPRNAPRYQALGINLYVGLWEGPTETQLADLRKCRMPVICDQNAYALAHLDEKSIVGWLQEDEPDNAQPLPGNKGYGPPVLPAKTVEIYRRLQRNDPSRPVLLNLGQAVAWDGWYGRGVRSNHPQDYPEYVRGCDIASFDIYPAVHDKPAVAGKLWYVARGVERLRQWTPADKTVWSCIECTRIGNVDRKPTPAEVRAEVWMSIIHGSRGLVYFCHQFQPKFIEAGLLADEEMSRAVGQINKQIGQLAGAINSSQAVAVDVQCSAAASPELEKAGLKPLAAIARRHESKLYIFAVRMEGTPAEATFTLPAAGGGTVEVLGEGRTLPVRGGKFRDKFDGYGVHLYGLSE